MTLQSFVPQIPLTIAYCCNVISTVVGLLLTSWNSAAAKLGLLLSLKRQKFTTIKELRVQLYSKQYFHAHVDYIFSQSIRMLDLVSTITDSSSNRDGSLTLHTTPVRVCFNWMEFYNVYWRQKAGTHLAQVRSPMCKSFLYLWPCRLQGFS